MDGNHVVPRYLEHVTTRGTIPSAHAIFVRCASRQPDDLLLDRLGIQGFARETAPDIGYRIVLVTHDSEWVHIFDDSYYTLWNSEVVRNRIPNLAKNFDVFTFFAGDTDDSLTFTYYRDGTRRRHFVAEDPTYRGRSTIEDTGVRLDAEADAFKHTDALEIGRDLARSVGIDLRHRVDDIRVYAKPYQAPSRPLINGR